MIIEATVNPILPRYNMIFVLKFWCTIKKPSELICISVFHFAKLVTSKVWLECKKKSLRPDTIISLSMMTNAG